MGKGAFMATVTHDDIYKEVRAYLLGLFSCPPEIVIKGFQNGSPLPEDAIVMSILFEQTFDVASNYYDVNSDLATVQQSVQVSMQVDFYGTQAATRSRKLANLWKNQYTTEWLSKCQPLYCKDPQQIIFINEKAQYEPRWMLEIELQYNPEFEHEQHYLNMPTVDFNKI